MKLNQSARRLAGAVTCTLSLLVGVSAHAAVIDSASLTGPSSINAGDTALFSMSLSLSPSSGAYQDILNSISLTFHSGDGQDATQSYSYGAALGSPSLFNFSQGFSYAAGGLFAATVDVLINDTAWYNNYVTTIVGYGTYSYSCGFFSTCYSSYPIYGTVNQPYSTNLQESTTVGTSLDVHPVNTQSVPEPAPILLGAAGLLAFTGSRNFGKRKRQS